MYLFKRDLLPHYFRDMICTLASQLHSHYTRKCNLFIYLPVELIFETSHDQFGFKDLRFSTR